MKKNIFLIIVVVVLIGLLVLTPQTKGVFELLLVTNVVLIALVLFISIKWFINMSPTYLLLCLGLAIGIKIKYIAFVSMKASEIFGLFIDYFFNNYGLILIGVIVFILSIYVLVFVKRISDVTARFSLDALPGKQMSIEADYSSWKLSAVEVDNKKEALQRDLNWFGAMDGVAKALVGATKLGAIITFVTIVVNSTIDMFRLGESFIYYLKMYSLLIIPEFFIFQFIVLLISRSCTCFFSADLIYLTYG